MDAPPTPRRNAPSRGSVRALAVYALAAAIGVAAAWLALGPTPDARVTITSAPAGATAWIDGRCRGVTPLTLTDLPRGEHNLCLAKHGYLRSVGILHVPSDTQDAIQLAPVPTCTLLVKTEPPGADVAIRGAPAGMTPLEIKGLQPGAISITIDKDGYQPITETLTLHRERTEVSKQLVSKAKAYLAAMIEQHPDDIANYTELAHHYMLRAEYDRALDVLNKGIAVAAKAPPGTTADRASGVARFYQELQKIYLGAYRYGDGDVVEQMKDEVVKLLVNAIEQYPDCPHNYRALIAIGQRGGRRERALNLLTEAAARTPDNPGIQIALGKEMLRLRRYQDATDAFNRAIKQQPDNIQARQCLAEALLQTGARAEAAQQLQAAAKRADEPKTKLALLLKAASQLAGTRQYDQAIATWEQAIALEPDPAKACFLRIRAAYYCRRLKRYDKARKLYEATLAKAPSSHVRKLAKRGLRRLDAEMGR